MSTATVHHLPSANPTLDEQVAALQPGQWVRVTWVNKDDDSRGVIEGALRRPSHLAGTLFVGENSFCLRLSNGHVNIDATKVETTPPDSLDMDLLAGLFDEWQQAMQAVDDKPVGRFGTGSNDAEQNAAYDAETAIRNYLRSVKL